MSVNPPPSAFDPRQIGVLLVGHGSTRNPDSGVPTRALADAVRARGLFGGVSAGFLREKPAARDALAALDMPVVVVVPNFFEDGILVREVVPRALGMDGLDRTVLMAEP